MLLKLYTLLLLSFFSMQAIQYREIPILKDLCALVVAKHIDKKLPTINSYENLQDAYATLDNIPIFKSFKRFFDIHVLIAKAYQKLHSAELLLWDRTLTDHNTSACSMVYSPNGKQLASCALASSNSPFITKIWDLQSGQCIKTLTGYGIGYSPCGFQVALGSSDNTIKIWDLQSGTNGSDACIQTLNGHNSSSIVYSPGGKQLAYGDKQSIKIWDFEFGQSIRNFNGHNQTVMCVAYNPNGKQLASGSYDKTIKIWNLESGTDGSDACIQTLNGHCYGVCSIAYHPNGQQLASGSKDHTIKLWNLESGTCMQTLNGHSDCIYSVVYSQNGQQLASGSLDHTIKIWNLTSGANESDACCIKTLTGHHGWVYAVACNPQDMQLASCSTDKTIKIWQSYYQNPQSIEDILFSLLSSFYITNNSPQIIDLYKSAEYEKLPTNHKNTFIDYINRYAIEHPNSSVKQLVELIEQKNHQKRTASCELENNSKHLKLS